MLSWFSDFVLSSGALPPDFMRNLMQQISQYAAAVATSAATAAATGQPVPPQPTPPGYSSTTNSSATTTGPNTPTTTPTAPPPPPHAGPQARVLFTRPPFAPNMPPPAFGARGTTINVRAAMPGQQPGQVGVMFPDEVPVCFSGRFVNMINILELIKMSCSTGFQPCSSQPDDKWTSWTTSAARTNGWALPSTTFKF